MKGALQIQPLTPALSQREREPTALTGRYTSTWDTESNSALSSIRIHSFPITESGSVLNSMKIGSLSPSPLGRGLE